MIKERKRITIERIQHYIVIASESHAHGCIHCIKSRMIDNQFLSPKRIETSFIAVNKLDYSMVAELKNQFSELHPDVYFTYNLFTKEIRKSLMLKYPQCEQCGETETVQKLEECKIESASIPIGSDYREKHFNEIVTGLKQNAASLIHPETGWFKNHYRSVTDSMPLIALDGYLSKVNYDSYGRNYTYKQAYYTAVLEGLERHQGVAPSTYAPCRASENTLLEENKSFISLDRYIHFESNQYNNPEFRFDKYEQDDSILWRYVYSFTQDRYMLAPEQIIYFSNHHFYKENMEKRYLPDSSNGIALGSNIDEASIYGLFELIERDAFMVYWFSRSTPTKLENIERVNHTAIQLILAYLDFIGYDVHLYDITLESKVPTYWVLLELRDKTNTDKMAFYTAAGANIDPLKAIESALIEASTSIKAFLVFRERRYKNKDVDAMITNFNNVKFLEDHLFLYSSSKMEYALSFALHSSIKIDAAASISKHDFYSQATTQRELLHQIIACMKPYHDEILQANLTSEPLKRLGFNCVKISVPTMQNISFGYEQQNVNKSRIKQGVKINQLDGDPDQINPHPHPFP
ncbi:YcaO-like family protein [Paenibacillus profundus]|uniref:YcaO-like family protein n=1 Tax=Paenibacillus profundus TaxID=1173085 RepID=A0ABS8YHC6_9BACL|nr:YcaO-like family protein [Paenibacillus profundus]MCE5170624.1 YcaO-like family protein [Paenibacillus profundus]